MTYRASPHVVPALATLLALAACDAGGTPGQTAAGSGGSSSDGGGDPAGSGGAGEGGGPAGPGATAGAGGDGGGGVTTVGVTTGVTTGASTGVTTGAGGGAAEEEVYAHSADALYRLDLETLQITMVGSFSGCGGSVIDIALDAESNMFGTTFGGLYRIDRTNAACTLVAEGDYPNSLSFVPAGTLDPDEEALVGFFDADYVRIDPQSGQVTTVRADALPGGLISSGDVVSVKDGPTLLTAKGGDCEFADCVLRIDPATGAMIENHGSSTFAGVFGIAYWDGKLYGFSTYGDVFEFYESGGQIVTSSLPIPSTPEFYGAGSTTSAPPGIFN